MEWLDYLGRDPRQISSELILDDNPISGGTIGDDEPKQDGVLGPEDGPFPDPVMPRDYFAVSPAALAVVKAKFQGEIFRDENHLINIATMKARKLCGVCILSAAAESSATFNYTDQFYTSHRAYFLGTIGVRCDSTAVATVCCCSDQAAGVVVTKCSFNDPFDFNLGIGTLDTFYSYRDEWEQIRSW